MVPTYRHPFFPSMRMDLQQLISTHILQHGPIRFRDYMEMALFHPQKGYYTASMDQIGCDGDFYTSPEFSCMFGILIGMQLEEMWRTLDKPPFAIVEYGAGTGALCHDILHYLQFNPELYERLSYHIIEKSPALETRQQERLQELKKVTWHQHICEVKSAIGCVLTNEVLDNFPVHRVTMQDELMEGWVNCNNELFEFQLPATEALKAYFMELGEVLPRGCSTEVNLAALEWLKDIADILHKGYILTIDYGYRLPRSYNTIASGTLTCYHKHKAHTRLFHAVGQCDITAHVNFSALEHWGRKWGVMPVGYTDQGLFLQGIGITNAIRHAEKASQAVDAGKLFNMYQGLMRMSRRFQVLIQQKGVNHPYLSGLQFAEPIRTPEGAQWKDCIPA